MAKCGLRPGTLKGELFRSLSEQGSSGLNVSDLAKHSKVSNWNKQIILEMLWTKLL